MDILKFSEQLTNWVNKPRYMSYKSERISSLILCILFFVIGIPGIVLWRYGFGIGFIITFIFMVVMGIGAYTGQFDD